MPNANLSAIVTTILAAAKITGVDPAIALALAMRESSLNPAAKGDAGEIGLYQIMPATAKILGFNGTAEQLAHPQTNALLGLKHFANLMQTYRNIPRALSAYNHGRPNIDNATYVADILINATRFRQAMDSKTLQKILVPAIIGVGAYLLATAETNTKERKK